jgi:hypothetical protein
MISQNMKKSIIISRGLVNLTGSISNAILSIILLLDKLVITQKELQKMILCKSY